MKRAIVCIALLAAGFIHAESYTPGVPDWFLENRVQAHMEHGIDCWEIAPAIHQRIAGAGSQVLTRIILNRDEGAWYPSAVGETHELAQDRDILQFLVDDVHGNNMKCIGYFRLMSDAWAQTNHFDWVCRDHEGQPVKEPRGKNVKNFIGVICLNSPYRDYIKTRLIEHAKRGVDIIYFDSWHMPPVCTCEYCKKAFEKKKGKPFPLEVQEGAEEITEIIDGFEDYPVGKPPLGKLSASADTANQLYDQFGDPILGEGIFTPEYLEVAEFVGETLVEVFTDWILACRKVNPDLRFAIGSSLYPGFVSQPQLTDDFLALADTSKTEFHKPFGGNPEQYAKDLIVAGGFAEPALDLQCAVGWSHVRDSSGFRPPLMWIPAIRMEQEARYSSAAAVTYGCIASMAFHGKAYKRVGGKRVTDMPEDDAPLFTSSYEMGEKVSPHLAHAIPYGWAAVHISDAARNRRLNSREIMWKDIFSPVLGTVRALKEEHIPWITLNDKCLAEGKLPEELKVLVLPWAEELTDAQKKNVEALAGKGVAIIKLDSKAGWHLESMLPKLMDSFLKDVRKQAGSPPVRVRGPKHMHAVYYRNPMDGTFVVALCNDWGWFHSIRARKGTRPEDDPRFFGNAPEIAPCTNVSMEIDKAFKKSPVVIEAFSGATLTAANRKGVATVTVPDFQIQSLVVVK
ncbi:MAG: hypothetical protein K9M45_00510 [Kiritimatiellales bacterium]|nr:hypothetical protein [Kiritimatiellales bacterium]